MSIANALEAQEFQRKGQLRWATFIVPLVPGGADRLRQIFKERSAQSSDPVEKVDTIHELRWVIFDDDTRAIFVTSWDGDLESYLTDFQTKVPDAGMRLQTTDLDFRFAREFAGVMPDAYQRLLLDALHGDASLFARSDEVEAAWSIIDPIAASWRDSAGPPVAGYPAGQWGPDASDAWMKSQGREWFDVCPVLH